MKCPKSIYLSGVLVAGIISLSGCQSAPEPGTNTASSITEPVIVQTESAAEIKDTPAVECLIEVQYPDTARLTDEERRQLQLSATFAENLETFGYESAVKILNGSNENGLYSPLSLYFALSMATAGAEGETEDQLLKLLRYPDKEALNADCSHAMQVFYRDDELHSFQIASSLWAAETVSWKDRYLKTMEEDYSTEVYRADFSDPKTGGEMGRWVKDRTRGLIEPAIPVTPQTIMTLMNTIYYYDQWMDQFDVEQTEEGTFTKADGQKVTCEFMNRTIGSHGYHRGEDYTVSSLRCKNGSVTFLLPDEGTSLDRFLEDADALQDALKGDITVGEVVWQVPKFSYGTSYQLNDALSNLGVSAAFSPEKADFSAMTDAVSWIDTIIQQNHIGIDENGIEAASFTMIAWAGAARPQGRAEMILDRPFLYVVNNRSCPVFIGICGDPTAD